MSDEFISIHIFCKVEPKCHNLDLSILFICQSLHLFHLDQNCVQTDIKCTEIKVSQSSMYFHSKVRTRLYRNDVLDVLFVKHVFMLSFSIT